MSASSDSRPAALFLHSGADLYGSGLILRSVVEHASAVVEPHVVLDSDGPLVERFRALGAVVHVRPLGTLRRKHFTLPGMVRLAFRMAGAVLWLVRYIRRNRIDLVYSNTMVVMPGAVAAGLTRRSHVAHIHEILVKPRWLARLMPLVPLALSDRVIAVSAAVRDSLVAAWPGRADRVRTIHNGISTEPLDRASPDAVRRELGIDPATLLVVLVGRIHFWKGQDVMVEAARLLVEEGPSDFRVLLVGDVFPGYEGLLEGLRGEVSGHGLEGRITFCGFRDDAPAFFRAADIVVVPSTLPDPLPTVVLEAMAARRPVIAAAHGGALEMIEEGVTGLLVPPGRAEPLAGAIRRLGREPETRERMGRAGRARLEAMFSEARFREDIRSLIAEVVADGGR